MDKSMRLPFLFLTLFLLFIYFEPVLFFPVLGSIRAAYLIAIIALIIALIKRAKIPKASQNKYFVLLLLTVYLSIFYALSIEKSYLAMPYLNKSIALYFLVIMIISSKDYLIRFYYVNLVLGSVVAMVTLFTTRAGIYTLKGGNLYRMTNYFGGIGDDPNEFGAFLIAFFPLPFFMVQASDSKIKKIVFSVITLVFMLCITRTRSRGAFLGLLITLAFIMWENRKRTVVIFAVLVMSTFVFLHTHSGYWERIGSLKSSETIQEERNAYVRVMQNQYAMELIELRPLTGVGLGNFVQGKISLLRLDPEDALTKYVAHNTYLGLGAEIGIIGLMAFLLIIITSIWSCYSSEKYFQTRDDLLILYNLSRAVRIGLIGLSVTIFFLSEQYNLIFYLWIAFSVVLKVISMKEKAHGSESGSLGFNKSLSLSNGYIFTLFSLNLRSGIRDS